MTNQNKIKYNITSEIILDDGFQMIKKVITTFPHNGEILEELCFYKDKTGKSNYSLILHLKHSTYYDLKKYFKKEFINCVEEIPGFEGTLKSLGEL